MVQRSILFTLLVCMSFTLDATELEKKGSEQSAVQKVRAFFKTKKGKALLGVLGVVIGWPAGCAVLQMWTNQKKINLLADVSKSWKQTFGMDVHVRFDQQTQKSVLEVIPTVDGLPVSQQRKKYDKKYEAYVATLKEKVRDVGVEPIELLFGHWSDGTFVVVQREQLR